MREYQSMIGAVALVGSAFAGYVGWPWWIAAVLGVGTGIWYFVAEASKRTHFNDGTREAARAFAIGVLLAALLFGSAFCGLYAVVSWIASG